MANPPVEERLDHLCKARDKMKDVMDPAAPERFTKECEGIFAEFRKRCVHLRREKEALDRVEQKDVAWTFICRFSKNFPFHHDRCQEVLKILMLCDGWMEEFGRDPDAHIEDLPAAITDEFKKKLEEVTGKKPPGAETNGPDFDAQFKIPQTNTIAVMVQRCVSAAFTIGDQAAAKGGGYRAEAAPVAGGTSIGAGLVVAISFADGATEATVLAAARVILTAKLSGGSGWNPGGQQKFGSGAESVVALCAKGERQGVLIIPQASLVADLGDDLDKGVQYKRQGSQRKTSELYNSFVVSMRTLATELGGSNAPDIVAPDYEAQTCLEVKSVSPFMHTLTF